MADTYWHKQTRDKPLFPELLWSRPENRNQAGKLAIIGGNSFGFAAVAEAYQAAIKAGVGTARVLLPEAVKKVVGPVMAEGEFAPSNPSGSFARTALAEFLDLSAWADGVLLAGDLGRNSETAILLEKFVHKYTGGLIVTKDAVDYFTTDPARMLQRPDTVLVLSLSQLQKLVQHSGFDRAVTFGMDLLQLVDLLHDFTTTFQTEIVVKHLENMFVAVDGQVSTTKLSDDVAVWRVTTAARAAVWRLQNSARLFEALSTSVLDI